MFERSVSDRSLFDMNVFDRSVFERSVSVGRKARGRRHLRHELQVEREVSTMYNIVHMEIAEPAGQLRRNGNHCWEVRLRGGLACALLSKQPLVDTALHREKHVAKWLDVADPIPCWFAQFPKHPLLDTARRLAPPLLQDRGAPTKTWHQDSHHCRSTGELSPWNHLLPDEFSV